MDATEGPGLAHAHGEGAGRRIRVLVVDDHDVLAESLAHELVGSAAQDVVLLDHSLRNGQGVDAIPALHAIRPAAHTVRNHISHLCAKLDAHSRLEALSVALRQGLLPPRG